MWRKSNTLYKELSHIVVVLKTFWLWDSLAPLKIIDAPQIFCFCGLYLSIFLILEIETEKFLQPKNIKHSFHQLSVRQSHLMQPLETRLHTCERMRVKENIIILLWKLVLTLSTPERFLANPGWTHTTFWQFLFHRMMKSMQGCLLVCKLICWDYHAQGKKSGRKRREPYDFTYMQDIKRKATNKNS